MLSAPIMCAVYRGGVGLRVSVESWLVKLPELRPGKLLKNDCLNSRKAVVVVYNFKLSQGRCKFPSGFSELEARNLVTITARPLSIQP
jgi:hypothetical protein